MFESMLKAGPLPYSAGALLLLQWHAGTPWPPPMSPTFLSKSLAYS
jgi:hypothetical protein